jgi:hypothetical protein
MMASHEVQRHWGKAQDMALLEPITVTSKGRRRIVILSWEEYTRLKHRDRRVMSPADFTEEDIEQIEAAEPPPEARAFNAEVME